MFGMVCTYRVHAHCAFSSLYVDHHGGCQHPQFFSVQVPSPWHHCALLCWKLRSLLDPIGSKHRRQDPTTEPDSQLVVLGIVPVGQDRLGEAARERDREREKVRDDKLQINHGDRL